MAAGQQFAYIEHLNSTRRLIAPADDLVSEPWRQAMTELGEVGAAQAMANAPYRTGYLREHIFFRVQKKPFPMWTAVRVRAKKRSRGRKAYDYARLLEYSPKHNHRGWFHDRLLAYLESRAEVILAKAAHEVEKRWSKGAFD